MQQHAGRSEHAGVTRPVRALSSVPEVEHYVDDANERSMCNVAGAVVGIPSVIMSTVAPSMPANAGAIRSNRHFGPSLQQD